MNLSISIFTFSQKNCKAKETVQDSPFYYFYYFCYFCVRQTFTAIPAMPAAIR